MCGLYSFLFKMASVLSGDITAVVRSPGDVGAILKGNDYI
jgi:hypothetical protein